MDGVFVGRDRELGALRSAAGRGPGAVVLGRPGVGKTRLAREAARLSGREVRWTSVTRETGTIPFGAFMTLAPELTEEFSAPGAALAGLGLVRRAVLPPGGRGSAVLVVDDGHLLDAASTAAVHHLVASGSMPVIVTVRVGERVPQAITALWKDEMLPRLEVPPLERGDADALAAHLLGGPGDARTLERLWNLSRGNPMELRELIVAARDSGALRERDGLWSLADDFRPTSRLVELVEDRMGRLDADETAIAEAVAFAEPLPLELLLHVGDPQVVGRLERAGVIAVGSRATGRNVMLGHPLYGEVLRARLPATRRVELAGGLAEGAARAGPAGLDPLRVATWRMEAGLADAEELAAAARDAAGRMAWETARRLAAASLEAKESYTAHTVMAMTLAEFGRVSEAEEHLRRSAELAESRMLRAWSSIGLADLWFFHCERMEDGLELMRAEAAAEPDPEIREHLVGALAVLLMMHGDLGEAGRLADEVLGSDATSSRGRLLGLVARSLVAGFTLRPEVVHGAVAEALPLAEEHRVTFPNADDVLLAGLLVAGAAAGNIPEARATLDERRFAALADDRGDLPGFWGLLHGQLLLYEGQARRSLEALQEALMLLGRFDTMMSRPLALVEAAHSAAVLGEPRRARRLLADVPGAARRTPRIRSRYEHVVALVTGPGEGVARAVSAGDRAAADHHLLWAIEAWHLAVRFGRPEAVIDRLSAMALRRPGTVASWYSDHAAALAAGDGDALEAVARRFADGGMPLLAAEAATQATAAHRRAGHHGGAQRAASAARRLLPEGSDARTPALLDLSDAARLTRREREVALLAAAGRSSKEIAERLGISVRTVDNHLGRSYAKLGIGGREQLGEALAGGS